MVTTHKSKNKKQQDSEIEDKKRCPKCGSKNILTIEERGDRTLSCFDCDYTEGAGTT